MKKNHKAFSLVELSIVILVIGILVAAIAKGKDLLKEIKVAAAQSLTSSSVVNSVENLTFWFETSDPNSFVKGENVNGNFITKWLDRNPQQKYKNHAYGGQKTNTNNFYYNPASGNTSGPEYIEDGIAGLPTLRFDNTGTNYRYVVVDPNGTNQPNKSFTLFMVIKYRGGSGYFIDRSCVNANNVVVTNCSAAVTAGAPLLNLYAETNGDILAWLRPYSGNGTGRYSVGSTVVENEKFVITAERNYNKNFITYINGKQTPVIKNESFGSFKLDPFKIGIHAEWDQEINSDISEVIFFNDSITSSQRDSIENYLGQKYSIKISH